jgi:hypothetical protein
MPKVSVIIPCFNHGPISMSRRSVLAQSSRISRFSSRRRSDPETVRSFKIQPAEDTVIHTTNRLGHARNNGSVRPGDYVRPLMPTTRSGRIPGRSVPSWTTIPTWDRPPKQGRAKDNVFLISRPGVSEDSKVPPMPKKAASEQTIPSRDGFQTGTASARYPVPICRRIQGRRNHPGPHGSRCCGHGQALVVVWMTRVFGRL